MRFSLNMEDLKKIGIGAMIAGAGALLVYFVDGIARLDFGIWSPAVTALASILVNIIRKWLGAQK